MNDASRRPARDFAYADDEIDLFELAATLWRGRYIWLGCVILATVLAVAYALTAAEQWTSKAQLNTPHLSQMADYLHQQQTVARIMRDRQYRNQSNPDEHSARHETDIQQISASELSSDLFEKFVERAGSRNNQLAYLKDTTYFENLTKGIDNETARQRKLLSLANHLTIKAPSKGQDMSRYTFSFSAPTPGEAQNILKGYVQYINAIAARYEEKLFKNKLDSHIHDQKHAIRNIELNLKAERRQNADMLKKALNTATLADIDGNIIPSRKNGLTIVDLNNEDLLFMLGQKNLRAKLKTLEDTSPIYPLRYAEIQNALRELESLRDKISQPQTYRYQLAPTLPVSHDKPRRKLIVIIGAVLGAIIGAGIVLLRHAIRERKQAMTVQANDTAATDTDCQPIT